MMVKQTLCCQYSNLFTVAKQRSISPLSIQSYCGCAVHQNLHLKTWFIKKASFYILSLTTLVETNTSLTCNERSVLMRNETNTDISCVWMCGSNVLQTPALVSFTAAGAVQPSHLISSRWPANTPTFNSLLLVLVDLLNSFSRDFWCMVTLKKIDHAHFYKRQTWAFLRRVSVSYTNKTASVI